MVCPIPYRATIKIRLKMTFKSSSVCNVFNVRWLSDGRELQAVGPATANVRCPNLVNVGGSDVSVSADEARLMPPLTVQLKFRTFNG